MPSVAFGSTKTHLGPDYGSRQYSAEAVRRAASASRLVANATSVVAAAEAERMRTAAVVRAARVAEEVAAARVRNQANVVSPYAHTQRGPIVNRVTNRSTTRVIQPVGTTAPVAPNQPGQGTTSTTRGTRSEDLITA